LIALVDMDRDCRASCLASSFWRFSSWAIRAFSAASRSFCAFASALARSLAAFSSALRSAARRFSSSFCAFFSAFSALCVQAFAGGDATGASALGWRNGACLTEPAAGPTLLICGDDGAGASSDMPLSDRSMSCVAYSRSCSCVGPEARTPTPSLAPQ